jgi:hypothetical protein
MDRVSNRLSRFSSVIYESSHLPDGTYNVSMSVSRKIIKKKKGRKNRRHKIKDKQRK